MRSQAKSKVITLSGDDIRLVRALRARLGLKSNGEVIRRGLRLLEEVAERETLREAYRTASRVTRRSTDEALRALDHLADEGLAEL